MQSGMNHFSFNIIGWRAVSRYFSDREQWQAWFSDGLSGNETEYRPALSFLPAMQRRRLGVSARLMFDAAWELAEQTENCPLVFVSHDGELNRSFELWLALLKEGDVSPTSFGLSVHNALAGQWSMLRGDMSENTALSVQLDGLETALAEAYALLCEGAGRVLVVLADDPLQPQYTVEAKRAPFPYALAMLLEKGGHYTVSMMPSENNCLHPVKQYYGALDWIRFMLSDGFEHIQNYGSRRWLWQKQK